jgi:metal-responsive CopG/Arc/MetJ family transcriptional regulator
MPSRKKPGRKPPKRDTITVSMDDELREWLDAVVKTLGHGWSRSGLIQLIAEDAIDHPRPLVFRLEAAGPSAPGVASEPPGGSFGIAMPEALQQKLNAHIAALYHGVSRSAFLCAAADRARQEGSITVPPPTPEQIEKAAGKTPKRVGQATPRREPAAAKPAKKRPPKKKALSA